MAEVVAKWWWIPAGLVVALAIAAAFGSVIALVAIAVYTVLNLAGTGLILREIADQEERPRSDRWRTIVHVAFVLQLPIGIVALLVEVL